MRKPHRWIWEQANGALTDAGAMVCHHCDRRACVNLLHLYRGDQASNMADRNRRGRQARLRGEANGNSRLVDAVLPEIRERYAAGETLVALGLAYGVSHQTIRRVVIGKRQVALSPRHPQSVDGQLP